MRWCEESTNREVFLLTMLRIQVQPEATAESNSPTPTAYTSGPGAIMSFDNREDFEKNLNGSLTVDSWTERWRMMEDDM